MDKWDNRENRWDEEERRKWGHSHNHGCIDGGDDDGSEGWTPRHHDPQPPDQDSNKKIISVSEASRLHEGKDVSVIGIISGIQPLRKMIKGLSVQCLKCNTIYERKYDKPELFESFVPVERIRKCPECKTDDYLSRHKYENINAVIVELKDNDTFSEIVPCGSLYLVTMNLHLIIQEILTDT